LAYPRHFALLACFSVLVALLANLDRPPTVAASFALYGALHATALIMALRAPMSAPRKLGFVLLAAGLCTLTYRVGFAARALTSPYIGGAAIHSSLGFSAAMGAMVYGYAARRLPGLHALTPPKLIMLSLGCLAATFLAALAVGRVHTLGIWCLAVAWWFAFSGGLCMASRPALAAQTE